MGGRDDGDEDESDDMHYFEDMLGLMGRGRRGEGDERDDDEEMDEEDGDDDEIDDDDVIWHRY